MTIGEETFWILCEATRSGHLLVPIDNWDPSTAVSEAARPRHTSQRTLQPPPTGGRWGGRGAATSASASQVSREMPPLPGGWKLHDATYFLGNYPMALPCGINGDNKAWSQHLSFMDTATKPVGTSSS